MVIAVQIQRKGSKHRFVGRFGPDGDETFGFRGHAVERQINGGGTVVRRPGPNVFNANASRGIGFPEYQFDVGEHIGAFGN